MILHRRAALCGVKGLSARWNPSPAPLPSPRALIGEQIWGHDIERTPDSPLGREKLEKNEKTRLRNPILAGVLAGLQSIWYQMYPC